MVFVRRGRFFPVVPFDVDGSTAVPWGVDRIESFAERVEAAVEENIEDHGVKIGVLTAADRDTWAEVCGIKSPYYLLFQVGFV